jgi:hypothetical protein
MKSKEAKKPLFCYTLKQNKVKNVYLVGNKKFKAKQKNILA